jgi:hypothetical protein
MNCRLADFSKTKTLPSADVRGSTGIAVCTGGEAGGQLP